MTVGVQKPDVFDEDVRGMIIGGDWISWKLYYGDTCMQHSMNNSDTDEEAIETARMAIKAEQAIWRAIDPRRYNDNTQWTIRIFNG